MSARSLLVGLCVLFAFLCCQSAARAQSEEEITLARRRGIDYIKSRQKSDGSWAFTSHDVGITALCTIALIENGIPQTDPVVQKGYEYVKKNGSNLKNTYDISLAIVLLSRMGDRRDKGQIKNFAARLIAGQMDSGGWHYNCPGQELDAEKMFRDPSSAPRPKEGFGDNSCTQFAVLGLWVSSRTGVNVEKTLSKVAERFKKHQLDDGGWSYVVAPDKDGNKPGASPSMTGAGLFCLAVAEAWQIREEIKAGRKTEGSGGRGKSLLDDKIFSKGFNRTGEFAKGIGPGVGRYFLWSVERVGVLLGLEKMGEVDWFQRGAAALLKDQKDDGGWPSAWADADKDGLSDTCFAVLFLRKANLGSDISRLLEGESEHKFEIVGRNPAARFDTIEKAVDAAQPGETVRINGAGPWAITHLELKKDITLQAGFGYAPVFTFTVGTNRLGIKLRPETDPDARDMISVSGGKVTLEGLRLRMDPPAIKQSVPWRAVTIKPGGTLRLLNCTISEINKQGTTGVMMEAPGRLVVRNSQFIGGKAAIGLVANDEQDVVFDNSVVFGNAGFLIANDSQSKKPANVGLQIRNSVFQVKEVFQCPKLSGEVEVDSHVSVYQADSIGNTLLASATDSKGRTWKGGLNLYDVKQWVGSGGKAVASIKDARTWMKFWGNSETNAFNRTAPFVGLRQMGNFAHDVSPQDWLLQLPADADSILLRGQVGLNTYVAGPGQPFDMYRETLAYSNWSRGRLEVTDGRRWPASIEVVLRTARLRLRIAN